MSGRYRGRARPRIFSGYARDARAVSCRALVGKHKEPQIAGNALELMFSALLEFESGTDDEVANRAGYEHLSG